MDVGWQLIWVVVTIGTACHGSCRYRAPAYKKLASSGSPHRYTSLIELSFKQKIEMDPSLFSMNGTCKQIRSNSLIVVIGSALRALMSAYSPFISADAVWSPPLIP